MGWSALRKFPTVFYCIFSASCTLTLMMMLMLSPSMLLHCSQKLMQKSKRKIIEINESCIFATFHSHSVYMCVCFTLSIRLCVDSLFIIISLQYKLHIHIGVMSACMCFSHSFSFARTNCKNHIYFCIRYWRLFMRLKSCALPLNDSFH